MQPNLELAKKLNRYAWGITILVLLLVGAMRQIKIETGIDFSFLPAIYSTLNALTAIILAASLFYIKQKNVVMHRKLIYWAIGCSALFLLGYVLYHFTTAETLFGDANHDGVVDDAEKSAVGGVRTFYLFLLASHVILAAVILPFILFTFIRAYTNQIDRHRKMAKWVFPLWLYVAVTGPILYFMLRPFYG